MTKKLLILVALVAINFQTTSCTSNKSQDESGVVENADVEKIEAEDNLVANTDAVPAESDASMQAALGETVPADVKNLDVPADISKVDSVVPVDIPPTNVAAAPTLDESSLADMPPAELPPIETAVANEPPPPAVEAIAAELPPPITAMNEPAPTMDAPSTPTESASMIENSGTNTAMADASPSYSKRAKSSFVGSGGGLKKISATSPYKTAGGWVNTVYVARPGETLKDISQKIFASDKIKQLKKIAENSYLKSRSVKPGDKVYYVSPNRPDDSGKTLMYYEDMGMVPEMYVAKKGDTLRKVAKQILGYDKGYIEMWTSNSVESKAKLNEGETIRYWKSASGVTSDQSNIAAQNGNQNGAQLLDANQAPTAAGQVAVATAPPQAEMPAMPPAPDSATLPPPPGQTVAANTAPQPDATLPPPPDATASLPPPPPPPPTEVAPPPPVEDLAAASQGASAKKKKPSADEEASAGLGGIDNDTLMSLGAVGVLTAMLAFVLIRRKKKKAAEQAAMSNEMNIG